MIRCYGIVVGVVLWLLLVPGYAQLSAVTVERFTVQLDVADGNYALPQPIAKRMIASVTTIAENVLVGRRIQDVDQKRSEYERLIQEVLDRILFGYTVKQVRIEEAADTRVFVQITPWRDVIKNVHCSVELDQIPDGSAELVRRDVQGIDRVVLELLQGLPLDAADWSQGILRGSIQSFLDTNLPEFRADLTFEPAETALVKIVLYPRGSVVRDVDLSLKSDSVPNIALLGQRSLLQKKADSYFIGLPIDFVLRHKADFVKYMQADFERDSLVQSLGIQAKLSMDVASKMQISVQADTDSYRVYVESYLDMGKKEDNTSVRIHMGKYISSVDEVFLETDFFPNRVKWVVKPGFSRFITPRLTLGVKYDLNESNLILWARHKINQRYTLRFEQIPKNKFHEVGLRYDVNGLVGLEYVMNSDEKWLRFVGNF